MWEMKVHYLGHKNTQHDHNLGHFNLSTLFLLPVAPTLEHGTSLKLFVSLQFLNPKRVGTTPWKGDQSIASPLPTQTRNRGKYTSMP
jgi:hypothetical protein